MQGYKAATMSGTGAKSAPRASNAAAASNGSNGSNGAAANANNATKKSNTKKKPAASEKKPTANGSDDGSARSAPPPPGFMSAAPAAPGSHVGFSEQQQRLLRHRALFVFRFLVGKAVEVTLVDSSRYVGILDCIDPDDFSIVLKNTQRKSGEAAAAIEPFDSGSTVIFKRRQLAHMSADGVVNYNENAVGPIAAAAAAAPGFRTDTEITNRSHDHLYGRELESAASWLDPQLDTGELEDPRRRSSSKNNWNQFEVNEKLFGVVSTFDENLYTTKLDKTKFSNEKSREAERLAREIERETTGNFHLQEERGQAVHGGDDLDEEAKYSSVSRKQPQQQSGGPLSRGSNAYVPPALRNSQRPTSAGAGGAPRLVSPKTPAAASPAPASSQAVSVTAPAATASIPSAAPAASAHKPISFSDAVRGRAAPRPSPTLTSAATPTAPVITEAPAKQEAKTSASPKPKPKPQPSPKTAKAPTVVAAKPPTVVAAKVLSPQAASKKEAVATSTPKTAATAPQPTKKPVEETKTEKKPHTAKVPAASATTAAEPVNFVAVVAPAVAPAAAGTPVKKSLNPNAREFKLSAAASTFTPQFATPPPAAAAAVVVAVSSPYRQPHAGGHYGHNMHVPPSHAAMANMGYNPMPEEWMYDQGMMLDESEYAAAHAYSMGYGMPMMPNPAMMQQSMYPPMMPPQQNVRMGRGGHAAAGAGGYGYNNQPGSYNQRGYYPQGGAVPGAVPYHHHPAPGPGPVPVPVPAPVPVASGLQPPLPPTPLDASNNVDVTVTATDSPPASSSTSVEPSQK